MDRRHHSIQLSTGAGAGSAAAVTQRSDDGMGAGSAAAVTQRSDDGMLSSELYLAVCWGRKKEAMALLLKHHSGAGAADQVAGIHQVSAERDNVLHLAAEQGHHELIQEIWSSFGNKSLLSARNSALDTPLHSAARAGHHRALYLLLQLVQYCRDDSILWCKNEAGDTALHLAARFGHGVAVEAMVAAVPELASEVNKAGVSPMYLAVMSKSVRSVRAITIRCSDASAAGPISQNALHAAVFQGSEMVNLLLDWKPSGPSLVSKADGTGSTPLHFAASDGDHNVVGAILRAAPPCAVRLRDSGGLSALHIAAGMGHTRVVEALIKACPDAAKLRDDRGQTFLHVAARGGHSKVVSLAINKPKVMPFAIRKPMFRGILNTQDGDGNTPLHLAVAAGAPAVVDALMSHGGLQADVMNNDGHTPLDLAARSTSFFSMLGLVATLAAFGAQSRPQRRDHVEQWSGRDIAKGIEKTSDSLAVVAILIATVSFTAANNIPGSYQEDQGMAVLQGKTLFKWFLILDSFALVTSLLAVVLLVFGKASRSAGSWKSFAVALHCIWASLISILLAFYAALAAVTSTSAVYRIVFHVISVGLITMNIMVTSFIAPPVSNRTVWKVLWHTVLRHGALGRRIKQQYPGVGAYAPNLILFAATTLVATVGFVKVSYLSIGAALEASHSGAPAPSSVLF